MSLPASPCLFGCGVAIVGDPQFCCPRDEVPSTSQAMVHGISHLVLRLSRGEGGVALLILRYEPSPLAMSARVPPQQGGSTSSSVSASGSHHLRYRVSPTSIQGCPVSITGHLSRANCYLAPSIGEGRSPSEGNQSVVDTLPVDPSGALGRGWADAREGDWAEIKHSGSRLPATARRQTTVPQADGLARWARVGGSDPHEAQPTTARVCGAGAVSAVAWPMRPVRGELARSLVRGEIGRRGRWGCAILDRRSRSYRRSTCSLRAGRCRFVISGISGIVEATWSRCLAREKPRVAPPAAPTRGSEGRHGSMMACSSASSVSWRDRPAPPHPRAPPQPGRGRLGSRHAIGAPCPDICLLSSTLERSPLRASRMRRILLPNRATARARADAGHAAPGDGASVSWLDACLGLGPDPSLPSSSSARIGPERLRRRVSAAPSTVRRGPLNQERREGPARR